MSAAGPDLRTLVAAVVRDVVTEMVGDAVRNGLRPSTGSGSHAAVLPASVAVDPVAVPHTPGAEHATPPDLRTRTEVVRIGGDGDLDEFARRLLALFENPKNRQDLRAGRLRFRLAHAAGPAVASAPVAPAERIETGAVTERHVKAAADAGRRLVLGRRAVLTPLARERARALGVAIEKER